MSKEGDSSGDAGSPDAGGASGDAAKDALYENRGPKKIVRIVTVLAYMFSVSSVAIVLSAYYLFLWEPPNPRLMHGASRLREGPRLHYLRADPPEIKSRFEGNLEDDFYKDNSDRTEASQNSGKYTDNYDNFDETLASLRSSLTDVLRERTNESAAGRYLPTTGGKNVSLDDRVKIGDERSQTPTDDRVSKTLVKKDTLQKAKFIPDDKSGVNDNTTRTLVHRREKEDGSRNLTGTAWKMNEYIVKRHEILWNATNNELIRSNDKTRYDDGSRKSNEGERKEEKKDARTTETQIEKVTARSTTINDTLERSEMFTTLKEKSLIEILTETTKSKQVTPTVLPSVTPTKVEMVDVVTIAKPYKEGPSRN